MTYFNEHSKEHEYEKGSRRKDCESVPVDAPLPYRPSDHQHHANAGHDDDSDAEHIQRADSDRHGFTPGQLSSRAALRVAATIVAPNALFLPVIVASPMGT